MKLDQSGPFMVKYGTCLPMWTLLRPENRMLRLRLLKYTTENIKGMNFHAKCIVTKPNSLGSIDGISIGRSGYTDKN